MADVDEQHHKYIGNSEVEIDCTVVSKLFKKLKNKGFLKETKKFYLGLYPQPSKDLLNTNDFRDTIKYYRILKKKSMREVAVKVGIDDESYRLYESKYNEIQDWRIAEKIINALEIENEIKLPDYFKIMKRYSLDEIKDLINKKYSRKEFSKRTGIHSATIETWFQSKHPKTISTDNYKKMVKFFYEEKIKY